MFRGQTSEVSRFFEKIAELLLQPGLPNPPILGGTALLPQNLGGWELPGTAKTILFARLRSNAEFLKRYFQRT